MPVTITVEHLGDNRFRFVSSSMSKNEAKKLDNLLSHNGYTIQRLASTKKKLERETPSATKERLRNFYKQGIVT